MTDTDPRDEFDRQVRAYIALGIPRLHGRSDRDFAEWVAPLRELLREPALTSAKPRGPETSPGAVMLREAAGGPTKLATERGPAEPERGPGEPKPGPGGPQPGPANLKPGPAEPQPGPGGPQPGPADPGPTPGAQSPRALAGGPGAAAGRLMFVLVVPGVPAEDLMPLSRQGANPGYVDLRPVGSEGFRPLPDMAVPAQPYLAIDVDTGGATLGVTPQDAARLLAEAGRLPLTIDEGIAALLLNPGLLRHANCFQLLASRDDSKRIPSLWVTVKNRPRLGWCFDRVPHSWLGAASCAERSSTLPGIPA